MTKPVCSLADDPQYQAVMDLLPTEYYQVEYVNIGQAIDVVTAMMGAMEESQSAERRRDTDAAGLSRRPFPPRAARRTFGHSRQSPTNGERRQDRA